jgi:hypothetical protein
MNTNSTSPEYARKRKELFSLLTSMGYPPDYANMAINQVDPTLPSAPELCFHWFEENPMPENFGQGGDKENDKHAQAVHQLMDMGFPKPDCEKALRAASGDLQRAVYYLLSDKTKELRDALRQEVDEYERMRAGTAGSTDDTPTGTTTPFDDNDTKFFEDLKKQDLRHEESLQNPAFEIKALTQQIVQLQDLVLTYQNKYLALKRRLNKIKKPGLSAEEEEAELRAESSKHNSLDVDKILELNQGQRRPSASHAPPNPAAQRAAVQGGPAGSASFSAAVHFQAAFERRKGDAPKDTPPAAAAPVREKPSVAFAVPLGKEKSGSQGSNLQSAVAAKRVSIGTPKPRKGSQPVAPNGAPLNPPKPQSDQSSEMSDVPPLVYGVSVKRSSLSQPKK